MIQAVKDDLSITDNLNVESVEDIIAPIDIINEYPLDLETAKFIEKSRNAVNNIIYGRDKRLLVITGPCSIHDPEAALEYAKRLKKIKEKFPHLLIVMRVYFDKPRSTIGWKGLLNDPDLDGSEDIEKGLRIGRELLLKINKMGIPTAWEALDVNTPQYIEDLYSWTAIGARTTESPDHRKMASSLSSAVGFKNGTEGNIGIAIDAIEAASHSHSFIGMSKYGKTSRIKTNGNQNTHIVLRGGKGVTNYDKESISAVSKELEKKGINSGIMVDVSHANSEKKYENQPIVCSEVAEQISNGNEKIIGVMIESNIKSGNQELGDPKSLKYGVSITDGCVDFETNEAMLSNLEKSVILRNQKVLSDIKMTQSLKALPIR